MMRVPSIARSLLIFMILTPTHPSTRSPKHREPQCDSSSQAPHLSANTIYVALILANYFRQKKQMFILEFILSKIRKKSFTGLVLIN